MKIGAYMPTTDGLAQAVSEMSKLGGNCIMVYTGSPKSFYKAPVDHGDVAKAELLKDKLGFGETIIHAPYIINPSNPSVEMQNKAISCLITEIHRTVEFGSSLLVFHPGSCLTDTIDNGIKNLARSVNEILSDSPRDVTLCVETMAGKGNEVCYRFEQIGKLYELVEDKDRLGVCFDTCHVHDAGYDLSPTGLDAVLEEFDKHIGLDKIKVLHINGSLNPRNAHKDRHANIGTEQDYLGTEALRKICQHEVFKDVPKILETPWDGSSNCYAKEIQLLKQK